MNFILIQRPNWPKESNAQITVLEGATSRDDAMSIAHELLPPMGSRVPWSVEDTDAYQYPTMEQVEDVCERVHGSGVDLTWGYRETRTSYRASNSFHLMNGVGIYIVWVDFDVIFYKRKDVRKYKIVFTDASTRNYGERYDLKELLYQWIEFAVSEVFGTAFAT